MGPAARVESMEEFPKMISLSDDNAGRYLKEAGRRTQSHPQHSGGRIQARPAVVGLPAAHFLCGCVWYAPDCRPGWCALMLVICVDDGST